MLARHKRMILIVIVLGVLALAVSLVLRALDQSVTFFYTPSEVIMRNIAAQGRDFRLGGLVKKDSIQLLPDGLTLRFIVSDTEREIVVEFKGIVPDLFREGQGVVATGKVNADGIFVARELLAKHDENYMPPELKKALDSKTPHKTGPK